MKRLGLGIVLILLFTGCTAPPSPNGRYQVGGQGGIVLDTATGMMWINRGPEGGWMEFSKGPIPTQPGK